MAVDRERFSGALRAVLTQLDFSISSDKADALYFHYSLLQRWNDRMNLTSVRGLEATIVRHYGESLAVAKSMGPGDGAVVDVGSGAGFPGFPIAVCWPTRPVFLVESVGKKSVFLKEVSRGRSNIRVKAGRFEDFDEACEWVSMRGVQVASIAQRVAGLGRKAILLVSERQVKEVIETLGLEEVQDHPLPWKSESRVVSGSISVPRGTETYRSGNV